MPTDTTQSGVRRYEMDGWNGAPRQCDSGRWVGYDDYAALERERDRLLTLVRIAMPHINLRKHDLVGLRRQHEKACPELTESRARVQATIDDLVQWLDSADAALSRPSSEGVGQ